MFTHPASKMDRGYQRRKVTSKIGLQTDQGASSSQQRISPRLRHQAILMPKALALGRRAFITSDLWPPKARRAANVSRQETLGPHEKFFVSRLA